MSRIQREADATLEIFIEQYKKGARFLTKPELRRFLFPFYQERLESSRSYSLSKVISAILSKLIKDGLIEKGYYNKQEIFFLKEPDKYMTSGIDDLRKIWS